MSFKEGFVLLNGHQNLGGRNSEKLCTTLGHLIVLKLLKSQKSHCLLCVGCHIDYPGFTGIRLVTLPGMFKVLSNHSPEPHVLWKCPYWVQQVLHSWEKLTKKFTLYRAEKKPPVTRKKLILLWLYFQEEFMAFIVTHVTGVTKEWWLPLNANSIFAFFPTKCESRAGCAGIHSNQERGNYHQDINQFLRHACDCQFKQCKGFVDLNYARYPLTAVHTVINSLDWGPCPPKSKIRYAKWNLSHLFSDKPH